MQTVGEVLVLAQACNISRAATKRLSFTEHVVDTHLPTGSDLSHGGGCQEGNGEGSSELHFC